LIYLILSYFDNRLGPKILITIPEFRKAKTNIYYKKIPILMDLYNKGFFIHEFGMTRTANMIFTVYNPSARGREDRAMLTLLSINEEYNIDLKSLKEIMECLVMNLKKDKNICKAFRYKKQETGLTYFSKIKDLLFRFYKALPITNFAEKSKLIKIPTYGLSRKDKSNIINFIRNSSLEI
jgi:hypothetical protein